VPDPPPDPLDLVQANILQPHVRNSCVVLLLQFTDRARGRSFLHDLAPRVKSATGHADEITSYRQTPVADRPGFVVDPYVGVGLSHEGYLALDVPEAARPDGAAFRAGMGAADLGDPDSDGWEEGLRPGAHAIVVIGSPTQARTELSRAYIRALATAYGVVVLSE